eukprot:PhF_6_TR37612/c0_g1_i1/m.55885
MRLVTVVVLWAFIVLAVQGSPNELSNSFWKIKVSTSTNTQNQNITYIEELRFWQSSFGVFSRNIIHNLSTVSTQYYSQLSTTSVTVAPDGKWYHASGGTISYVDGENGTSLIVTDIRLGNVATETWTLSLINNQIMWEVERNYLQPNTNLLASRYQTFSTCDTSMTIGSAPASAQAQLVSTIDPTFSWNTTGASAYAQRYGTSQDELWGVTYSAKPTGMLLLSPADSCVRYDLAHVEGNGAAANFSMQWSDQRVPIAIGVARVPRSNTTTAMRETVRFSLTLESDPAACTSSSMLSFTTQNKTRDALIQQMGRTFNMWYGNFIGNSPQGTLCMFETGILAMINTVFVPNHGEGRQSELLASMRHQLEFFLKTAVNTTSGLIKNQWTSLGFALYPAMQQQQTQFLLALYHYCVTSGDKTLLTKYWNSTLMPIFTYLLKTMGLENNGYATAPDPRVSGVPGIVQSDNWMDTIDF